MKIIHTNLIKRKDKMNGVVTGVKLQGTNEVHKEDSTKLNNKDERQYYNIKMA